MQRSLLTLIVLITSLAAVSPQGATQAPLLEEGAWKPGLEHARQLFADRVSNLDPATRNALEDAIAAQGANFRRTETLLGILSKSHNVDLALGLELAAVATQTYVPASEDVIDLAPQYMRLSDAVTAVLRLDREPTADEVDQIGLLDELPFELRDALLANVNAYLDFAAANDVTQGRLAGLRSEGIDSMTSIQWAHAPTLVARVNLLRVVPLLAGPPDGDLPAALTLPLVLAPALILDPLGTDQSCATTPYTVDVRVSVDLGGNDCYHNNAGGSRLLLTDPLNMACDIPFGLSPGIPSTGHTHAAAVLIDVQAVPGSGGDDVYGRNIQDWSCGLNGGGYHGAGFLVDLGGSDEYVAQGTHTTFPGYGAERCVKIPTAGEIRTNANVGSCGVNGGAQGGTGFLLDVQGSDCYAVAEVGGACGGTSHNRAGFGLNGGGAYAGIGMLLDVGLEGEQDHYAGYKGGTNGGGHTVGFGFLMDVVGNDVYDGGEPEILEMDAVNAVTGAGTNGGGDGARGFLLDVLGNDEYTAGAQATNGGARRSLAASGLTENRDIAPGVGFLADVAGQDEYAANRRGTNGGAHMEDNDILGESLLPGGSGALLDLGMGDDSYQDQIPPDLDPAALAFGAGTSGSGDDCTKVPKGVLGLQFDDSIAAVDCDT